MSNWRQRLGEWMSGNGPPREGRSSGRMGAKSPGMSTGKSSGKTTVIPDGPQIPGTVLPLTWALAMGLVLLVLHLILFPPVTTQVTFEFPALNELASQAINAPFAFQAPLLASEVEMNIRGMVTKVPPVFNRLDEDPRFPRNGRVIGFLDALTVVMADTTQDVSVEVGILTERYAPGFPEAIPMLMASADPEFLVPRIQESISRIMSAGVVDRLPDWDIKKVAILTDQAEEIVGLEKFYQPANLQDNLVREFRDAGLAPQISAYAAHLIKPLISPNLIYNNEETGSRVKEAENSVQRNREFLKGEQIIGANQKVTEQHQSYFLILENLLQKQGAGETLSQRISRTIVRVLLVALTLGLFGWLALVHFQDTLRRMRLLMALTAILAVYLIGASFALSRPALGPLAVPVVLLSLWATVLLKARVGYTVTLLGVTILAFLPGVEPASIFTWYVLGMVTVVSVRRVQKRSQFYRTILLLTFLSLALIFLLGPESFGRFGGNNHLYLVGLFTSAVLVLFGLFMLPVVEPLVGVCSDLTLLELSDLNHPLLKRMALEAQGTYHHSQVVGQLAEHAARAIDANALLTRVGALFHDIGKMQKSEYYVENQRPEFNKHDELSPSMSALVIAAHVKDGIELGRKWRLPQMVIDFIPEHHGTMVMEFFYHKALEGEGNQTVKVDDFRYPGPKPRSRETAILMLADAVEAATRALPKPTPSRIREVTKQIIDKRMLSGEMDASGLTLSDLAAVRESFIPLLNGIHHARIVYPGQKERDGERIPERRGERKAGT